MSKAIFFSIILFSILTSLGFSLKNTKNKLEIFDTIQSSLVDVSIANQDFNHYINSSFSYYNFDNIHAKIDLLTDNISIIKKDIAYSNLQNLELINNFEKVEKSANSKIEYLQKIESYRAILNNSFRLIQKIYKNIDSKLYHEIYTDIMTFDKDSDINLNKIKENVKLLVPMNNKERYFIQHSEVILSYYNKYQLLKTTSNNLNTKKDIDIFRKSLDKYSKQFINNAKESILLLFTILTILILTYLLFSYKLFNSNKKLSRFKKAVEASDNIIIVTDTNQKIKYVNEAFTRSTGYKLDDLNGKTPRILKSGKQPKEFYKNLNDTIKKGQIWNGEFINYDKNNNIKYEKASIVPIFDDGKIVEYMAIKLDITEDILKNQLIKEKDDLLAQQSKMAAMGEMLENIAHQWRQPLSAISSNATSLILQKNLDIEISDKELLKTLSDINNSTKYLSETINSFRNFFKSDNEKKVFNLKNCCENTKELVSSKIRNRHINLVDKLENVSCIGIESEFVQVVMNLYNNAIDALENYKGNKYIITELYENNTNVILKIKDNAGGIKDDIVNRIFEPYFTTKHQSQGTGIGLYMSREIIVKHMLGEIVVKNSHFEIDTRECIGAEFIITLPKV